MWSRHTRPSLHSASVEHSSGTSQRHFLHTMPAEQCESAPHCWHSPNTHTSLRSWQYASELQRGYPGPGHAAHSTTAIRPATTIHLPPSIVGVPVCACEALAMQPAVGKGLVDEIRVHDGN